MKLNLARVCDAKMVNNNTISGTIRSGNDSAQIEITRSLNGWQPHVEVKIGGVIVHYDNATENDMKQFDNLVEHVHELESDKHDAARQRVKRFVDAVYN